ncbi:MAG TPA: BsuPI-related putative proteinase inhibitor [Longimicrobiales bacterium]|nr:BsuPI-related putative proteinase inhibitor [Longimicrobiales bacterium]
MKHGSPPPRSRGFVALALALLLPACATPQGGEGEDEGDVDADSASVASALAISLEAQVREAGVHFRLHATNTSGAPLVLDFRSGQRFDFIVREANGGEVWRWSEDRMFTQALGQETLDAGETVTFEATWRAEGRTGTFVADGRITTTPPLEQETTFVLPDAGGA